MKRRISIEQIDFGTPISEIEMRENIGGADRDGGTLNNVTIYSDPKYNNPYNPDLSGFYYNPATGGHDSAAPSSSGGGGYYTQPPAPISCTISNLPTLPSGDLGQVGNSTCSIGAMKFIENYFKGTKTFDDLTNVEANFEFNNQTTPAATSFFTAKLDVLTSGFKSTPDQFATMVGSVFNSAKLDTTQQAFGTLNGDHPVMGFLTNSVTIDGNGNKVIDGHEIVIVGYDAQSKQYNYFDPLDAKDYNHKISTDKVSNLIAITGEK